MAIEFLFKPRVYQLPLLKYLFTGGTKDKRAVLVWHRRGGKDITLFNALITAALYDRIGVYYYMFPTYAQAKKVVWDNIDSGSQKVLSYLPTEIIAKDRSGKPKLNETELTIELINGSIIQLIGTDRLENLRGTNPVGCVISEYQMQNKRAWETVEPVLIANGGWAAFAYTPRGHNHGFDLYEYAKVDPEWFHQLLTIDDTRDELGKPIMSHEAIQKLRNRGVDEDFLQQEYFCSFSGAMQGNYYGKLMLMARQQGRVGIVPYESRLTTETWWDLGRNDATAIWFIQHVGREVHAIDYYENRQLGLAHYVKVVREKDYVYERHIMPHDINVVEFGSNVKRIDTARSLGLQHIYVAPKLHITEGIEAVRSLLPRTYFDEKKCSRGIIALEEYHKDKDDELDTFKDAPVHDWTSNPADAFRTGAVCERSSRDAFTQTHADTAFSIFSDQQTADNHYSVMDV